VGALLALCVLLLLQLLNVHVGPFGIHLNPTFLLTFLVVSALLALYSFLHGRHGKGL